MRHVRASAPLLACLGLLLAPAASAVVHTTGDGSGNTTAPPDDPGFVNVARSSNNLSGVYLGGRWVLTAAHVGERSFELDGVLYEPVVGSFQRIQEEGTNTDLALVRLVETPPLPPVVLATASPQIADTVTLIGHGWNREADLTCWDANWAETLCPLGVYEGYERLGGRAMRWGRNRVSMTGTDLPLGSTTTRMFETDFDEAGITHEAQLVTGDSGGGVFLKRGDTWELVGIHSAASVFTDQPSHTAVFGNRGFSIDVYHYRQQIEEIIAPVPEVPALPWPALPLAFCVVAAAARRSLASRPAGRS